MSEFPKKNVGRDITILAILTPFLIIGAIIVGALTAPTLIGKRP